MRYRSRWGKAGRYAALSFFASLLFCVSFCAAAEPVKYEYRVVPLGSLTALQKDKGEERTRQLEDLLNARGQEGWELVNVFAVRTSFDPNVFFALMKRPLSVSGEVK